MRRYLMFLAAMLLSVAVRANEYTYVESIVPWSTQRLTWDDFRGIPKHIEAHDTLTAMVSLSIIMQQESRSEAGCKIKYYGFRTEMDRTLSWVRDSCRDESHLLYMQTMFDKAEFYSRRATRELIFTDVYPSSLLDFYMTQLYNYYYELSFTTGKGSDEAKVREAYDEVQRELQSEYLELEPLMHNKVYRSGIDMNLGLTARAARSDYFDTGFGLDLGVGFTWGKSMLLLNMDAGFGGECKQEFDTDDGPVYKGEDLNCLHVGLGYGYKAVITPKCEIAPYIMVGVGEVSSNTAAGRKNNGTYIYPKQEGFSLAVGAIVDFPLYRRYQLFGGKSQISYIYQSLRVRPSIGVTQLGDLGWTPMLGISIGWGMAVRGNVRQL